MKYKIENEGGKTPIEPTVTLSFEREPDGSVNVMASGWYVLTFGLDGRITRCGAVPSDIGFKVDSNGRVLVHNERA